jgi:hypothetical protein
MAALLPLLKRRLAEATSLQQQQQQHGSDAAAGQPEGSSSSSSCSFDRVAAEVAAALQACVTAACNPRVQPVQPTLCSVAAA